MSFKGCILNRIKATGPQREQTFLWITPKHPLESSSDMECSSLITLLHFVPCSSPLKWRAGFYLLERDPSQNSLTWNLSGHKELTSLEYVAASGLLPRPRPWPGPPLHGKRCLETEYGQNGFVWDPESYTFHTWKGKWKRKNKGIIWTPSPYTAGIFISKFPCLNSQYNGASQEISNKGTLNKELWGLSSSAGKSLNMV